MRKRRVVGRIYGVKYSWHGHKDRNRHKNRIKRSGQARLDYVENINHNIPTTERFKIYKRDGKQQGPLETGPGVADSATTRARNRYIRTLHLRKRFQCAHTIADSFPGPRPVSNSKTVLRPLREASIRAHRPLLRMWFLTLTPVLFLVWSRRKLIEEWH